MIVVETDRIYAIYVRTNSHCQWKYSTYGGRWETPERALEIAKSHMNEPFEYLIENIETGETVKKGREVAKNEIKC